MASLWGTPLLSANALTHQRAPGPCKQAAIPPRCRQVPTAALDELSGQMGRLRRERAASARGLAPTAESLDATSSSSETKVNDRCSDARPMSESPAGLPSWPRAVTLSDVTRPVEADVAAMNANLRDVVANRHPKLQAAADHIFGAGGKKMRPMIVFLVARATADLSGLRSDPLRDTKFPPLTDCMCLSTSDCVNTYQTVLVLAGNGRLLGTGKFWLLVFVEGVEYSSQI